MRSFNIILLSCLLSTAVFSKPIPKIQKSLDASVMIVIKDIGGGSGTSVFYDENRKKTIVVTNNHVCQLSRGADAKGSLNKVPVLLVDAQGGNYKAKIVFVNPSGDDLCLIETSARIPTATLAPVGVDIGTKVYTIGAPKGWFPIIYEGYAGTVYIDNGLVFQVMVVQGTYGSSGSGVYDFNTGEYVGTLFAMYTHDEKKEIPFFMMAVPVNSLRVLMQKYSDNNKLDWNIFGAKK